MKKKDIKFFELGDESNFSVVNYDNDKVVVTNVLEEKEENEKYEKTINCGMISVIYKDLNNLSSKIAKTNKDIVKKLAICGIILDDKLDDSINNIANTIEKLEEITTNVIIKKNNIKVGMFSTRKKEKREQISSLEELINCLSRYQNEYIAINEEYKKLKKREENISLSDNDPNSDDDPLERTVNFFVKKEQKDI